MNYTITITDNDGQVNTFYNDLTGDEVYNMLTRLRDDFVLGGIKSVTIVKGGE